MRIAIVNKNKDETSLNTFSGKRVYPSSLKASKLLYKNNKLKSQIAENISNTKCLILVSEEFTNLVKYYQSKNLILYSNIFKIEERIHEIIIENKYETLLLISSSTYDLFYLISIDNLTSIISIKGIHTLCNNEETKQILSNIPDDCIYPCKIPTIGIPKGKQKKIF